MKLYSKYIIVFAAVISFCSFIPYFYAVIFAKSNDKNFAYYSEIIDDFVVRTFTADRQQILKDKAGNEYNDAEFKKLLPQVYVRDLMLSNSYTELINGKLVSAEEMVTKNYYFTIKPKTISENKIRIRMMPVFETKSGSATFEMPEDMARIGKDITFINARTIKEDKEKSALFTSKLKEKGFVFPVRQDGSNPDIHKSFDAGIFLIDSNNQLYRFYMAYGEPVIDKYKANLKDENVVLISIQENKYVDTFGYMVTDKGKLYIINNNYTLTPVIIKDYNPYQDTLRVNVNPLHILVTVIKNNKQEIMLYDTNYNFIKQYDIAEESSMNKYAEYIYDIIFPYTIYSDSNTAEKYLKIDFSRNKAGAFIFALILTGIYLFICKKSNSLSKLSIIDAVIILLSGIYGFTALILLQNFKRDTLWE